MMLTRSELNIELGQPLASVPNGNRLWMIANPASGTIVFKVYNLDGERICETLSLEKALEVYNGE